MTMNPFAGMSSKGTSADGGDAIGYGEYPLLEVVGVKLDQGGHHGQRVHFSVKVAAAASPRPETAEQFAGAQNATSVVAQFKPTPVGSEASFNFKVDGQSRDSSFKEMNRLLVAMGISIDDTETELFDACSGKGNLTGKHFSGRFWPVVTKSNYVFMKKSFAPASAAAPTPPPIGDAPEAPALDAFEDRAKAAGWHVHPADPTGNTYYNAGGQTAQRADLEASL